MQAFRVLFAATGAALALAVPAAHAQFAGIDAQRRVAIEGHLLAVDTATGVPQAADFADERTDPPIDLPRLQVGLALSLPDLADAQGRAVLDSRFDAGSLSFAALADANVGGIPREALEVSGRARATVDLALHFSLAQAATLRLAMDSSVAPLHDDDFRFLLARDDGTPVWAATTLAADGGEAVRAFTTLLHLDAGAYALVAALSADARFDANGAVARRALADVAITLVPEPPAALLLGAGLLPLLWRHRRRPACHA